MNPNTLELITKELTELNQLRLFKSKMVEKLFGDLPLASYKPDDEDIFNCVQGFKNLSTGWDEEDEDGDIDILAYHHPSYNQLKERVSKLSKGLVGGGIIPLKKENDELRLKVDALEKTIVEQKEDIQQYKDTLDEHLHHYDLLKDKSQKIETINTELYQKTAELKTLLDKATGGADQLMKMFKFFKEENKKHKKDLQVVWEVLGESSYADELNKRLFPENFEEEEDEVNCHKCKELGTNDKPVGGATDEDGKSICDDCYDEWDCQ